jgi:hypothetical protein
MAGFARSRGKERGASEEDGPLSEYQRSYCCCDNNELLLSGSLQYSTASNLSHPA